VWWGEAVELPDGEPEFGPWTARSADDVLDRLGRPRLLAVDGRSGSGKSTLAARIAAAVPGAAVVHTDDVAWYHDFFDWAELMAAGVLRPLRGGAAVHFRPPEWDARARPGAIAVPAGCPLVIVEGVGIGRRDLAAFFDAVAWVQTDRALATERGLLRDGGDTAFWAEWEARERPFLAAERPWERAGLVLSGAADGPGLAVAERRA
jgi:energy-coupling factor transporter ATP-binding protein EcfA2